MARRRVPYALQLALRDPAAICVLCVAYDGAQVHIGPPLLISPQAALFILPALIGLDPVAGVVAASIAAAVETPLV